MDNATKRLAFCIFVFMSIMLLIFGLLGGLTTALITMGIIIGVFAAGAALVGLVFAVVTLSEKIWPVE